MSLVGVEEQREERNYCGRLCYRSIGSRRWKVDFTIVLKVFIAAVDAKYAGADARMGPSQEVVFEGEKITLDIPLGGIVLENGWAITPCTYPGITKHEVDKFVPGGRVPSCQLDARWTGQQEQPVQLEHKMELLGAKEPNDVIMIHIPPPQGSGATLLDISTSELPQHKLNLHDLPLLMEQFQPVANIWRLHGVTLGLTLVELDEIEGMPLLISGGPAAFLQEMLYRWLKRAPPSHPFPTLTMLCDALRSGGTVEERRVAYNLEQHYLVQKTGISVSRFSDMFPSELPQQQRGKQGVLTLKDLSIELEPVMDWYTLGIKLGVKYHKLKEIEEQYHQPQRCKHEVLSRWLRKGHNCTWRRVVEVLMQMGEMVVADTIKLKYLTLTTAAKIERVSMSGTTRPAPSQPPPAKKPKGQVSPMLPSRQGQSGHYRGVLNTMYQGGVITKPERVDIEHRREGGGVTGYTGIVKFKIGTNGQKMEFRGHGGSKKAAHEDAAQRAVNVMRISAQRSPDMLPGELLQHQLDLFTLSCGGNWNQQGGVSLRCG